MGFEEKFNDLCKCADFSEVEGSDCIRVFNAEYDGEQHTACVMWAPLLDLDKLMQRAKEVELSVNGIKVQLNPAELKLIRLFKGKGVTSETLSEMRVTATAIIYQYKQWLEKRQRFFKGMLGTFYDFGELSELIAYLALLSDSSTYSQFMLFLQNMLLNYTAEHNNIVAFLEETEGYLREELNSKPRDMYNFLSRKQALQSLMHNHELCNIKNIAFIYAKLLPLATIEQEIEHLRTAVFATTE